MPWCSQDPSFALTDASTGKHIADLHIIVMIKRGDEIGPTSGTLTITTPPFVNATLLHTDPPDQLPLEFEYDHSNNFDIALTDGSFRVRAAIEIPPEWGPEHIILVAKQRNPRNGTLERAQEVAPPAGQIGYRIVPK